MKPILFSTPMVQAILDGRKTMTRRVMNPQPTHFDVKKIVDWNDVIYPMPKYKVGDILWVRETTCYVMLDDAHDLLEGAKDRIQFVYKASVHSDWMEYAKEKFGYKWKPSIFMPREAARIFLRVTDIRVERLKDISEKDAIAEGIEIVNEKVPVKPYKDYLGQYNYYSNPINSFKSLWESINGEKSWEQNPYVWVIHFEKITKPTK
jgi:hypothetical protein